jgi:acetolactate synthase small subunit
VLDGVKENIVSLVIRDGIDLHKVMKVGADENEVTRAHFVFSVLNDTGGVPRHEIKQLIEVVRVHGIDVGCELFRALVLVKKAVADTDIIV